MWSMAVKQTDERKLQVATLHQGVSQAEKSDMVNALAHCAMDSPRSLVAIVGGRKVRETALPVHLSQLPRA